MRQVEWYVMREVRVWQFVENLNMFCWCNISREKVSPNRQLVAEANADFEKLGFALKGGPGVVVQCHDDVTPRKKWVRYIVQCEQQAGATA